MKRRKPLRSDPEKIREWERRSRERRRVRSGKLRRSRLRPVGRRKKRMRRAGLVDGPLCDYVRGNQCGVDYCVEPGVPHHVEHGTLRVDWTVSERTSEGFPAALVGRVCCLCHYHHQLYHDQLGSREAFLKATGLDVDLVAEVWGELFAHYRPAEYRRIMDAA